MTVPPPCTPAKRAPRPRGPFWLANRVHGNSQATAGGQPARRSGVAKVIHEDVDLVFAFKIHVR